MSKSWRVVVLFVAAVLALDGRGLSGQEPSIATFKTGIDLVRVAAVVRDKKGHFVQDLSQGDFEVIDGGINRAITDFRHDSSGISVAILMDVSGSMEGSLKPAQEAANHLLSWLDPTRDEAAVFAFD